jgi:hypothetical protein
MKTLGIGGREGYAFRAGRQLLTALLIIDDPGTSGRLPCLRPACSIRIVIRVIFTFVIGLLGASLALGQEDVVRQVIIRAPQDRVMAAALQFPDDQALADVLRQWVADGTASVVSELSGKLSPGARVEAKSGRMFDWVTENDQEFGSETGVAVLIPTATDQVFIGSLLEAELNSSAGYKTSPYVEATWHAFFSPYGEKTVPWPYWWPETRKLPKVSWYPQKDFYVEEVMTSARFTPGSSAILGIMHRADHLEPDAKSAQTLDVVMAQIDPADKPRTAPNADAPDSPHGRCTVLGFGMSDLAALRLLSSSTETHGKPLLDILMKKVTADEAKVRLFTSLAAFQGQRSNLKSVRQHSYPTEMPTIPSAWESRDMGTVLAIEGNHHQVQFELEHHPASYRRQEWRCALETPDLFMWQPQFFVQRINTMVDFRDEGAALLGVMRTPDCHKGAEGIIPGETVVFVAVLDGLTVTAEDRSGTATAEVGQSDVVEIEAIVFDLPAAEGAEWKMAAPGLAEDVRFAALMDRAMRPDVKLAAHIMVTTVAQREVEVSTLEEVLTVTEVDPPTEISPTRYRPTAMETISCGTKLKAGAVVVRPEDPLSALGPIEVHVDHVLEHHVSAPVEPDFDFLINSIRNNPDERVPQALVFEESWSGRTKVVPGQAHFIGVREPPGVAFRERLHVAFLRARVSEGRKATRSAAPADPFAPAVVPK